MSAMPPIPILPLLLSVGFVVGLVLVGIIGIGWIVHLLEVAEEP